jgi:hypothetical protein
VYRRPSRVSRSPSGIAAHCAGGRQKTGGRSGGLGPAGTSPSPGGTSIDARRLRRGQLSRHLLHVSPCLPELELDDALNEIREAVGLQMRAGALQPPGDLFPQAVLVRVAGAGHAGQEDGGEIR